MKSTSRKTEEKPKDCNIKLPGELAAQLLEAGRNLRPRSNVNALTMACVEATLAMAATPPGERTTPELIRLIDAANAIERAPESLEGTGGYELNERPNRAAVKAVKAATRGARRAGN